MGLAMGCTSKIAIGIGKGWKRMEKDDKPGELIMVRQIHDIFTTTLPPETRPCHVYRMSIMPSSV